MAGYPHGPTDQRWIDGALWCRSAESPRLCSRNRMRSSPTKFGKGGKMGVISAISAISAKWVPYSLFLLVRLVQLVQLAFPYRINPYHHELVKIVEFKKIVNRAGTQFPMATNFQDSARCACWILPVSKEVTIFVKSVGSQRNGRKTSI